MDRGGIPANNFWPFVGDSNGLGKGVSVLERIHSNSAYEVLISIFISSLVCFSFNIDQPWNASRILQTTDCVRS